MRRLLIFASLAFACGSSSSPRKLVILHSNDEHSHLLGYGPEADDFPPATTPGSGSIKGGAARRMVALAAQRTAATAASADSLTLSAGDNMMGTLMQIAATTASPDYRVLKMLSYDATTLGNHEFDYTPLGLALAVAAAQGSPEGLPPIVATNIHFSGDPAASDASLAALFDETGTDTSKPIHRKLVLTTPNGLKVGLIGILGANAASVAPLKSPVTFSVAAGTTDANEVASLAQIYDDVQPFVDSLRHDDQVDLVVALSHSGADLTNPTASEDFAIAQNVSGLDVIISGHTHTDVPATIITNRTGRQVLVQQAGRYGDHIGKITLSVQDGVVTFDVANSGLLAIDDTTQAPAGNPIDAFVAGVIQSLEQTPIAVGEPSFLAYTLGEALQIVPPALTATGQYYNFPVVGAQDFDVDNTHSVQETQLLDLSADAQLAAANTIGPTQLAVEASGVLRVPSLLHSKANTFGFGDVFAAVPLGVSPASGTPGYPLCRFGIFMGEVKATFEVTAGFSYTSNSDLYVVPSGFQFEYDTTRPEFDANGSITDPNNGRITKMSQLSAADLAAGNYDGTYNVVFDASKGGWASPALPLQLVPAAASLYLAEFAALAGVRLKFADGPNAGQPVPNNDPTQTIVHRADTTEIKEWEALASYVKTSAIAGKLPTRYQLGTGIVPRRATCVGANATGGNCTH